MISNATRNALGTDGLVCEFRVVNGMVLMLRLPTCYRMSGDEVICLN